MTTTDPHQAQLGHIIAVLHAGEAVRLTLRHHDGADLAVVV